MKRVIIVHGWDGYPAEGIFPYLKKELENRGYEVQTPFMPNPLEPTVNEWVSFLDKIVDQPDTNTILFGHSIGSQTILRYLETLPENSKIGGAVLLAPWVNLTDNAFEDEQDKTIAKPWLNTPLDWNKIKTHTDNFTAIFSDNDSLVPISDSKIFKNKLNAKIIIEHNKGHFSGSDEITELSAALESILEISK
ncbi:MAG: hypothetical protein COU29_01110 [Candidatus Magasanikbacteria bacterium CG10_big_fil_rev_8_21_14_0_10_36_32]|uniref:Serine hydrolase family protein n=1 Tax=Candidatus Magasanikbacteria bacterium CG10_big_fil_rev_8_21_14_0_10_36_32 TaxID=1974646 RepID=A0A2M6W6E8_9BACT|nr:MAG: hypothetical protein COU29_01110 [Candidatus Magasanikbacteria bacterium CG10_big_fil_rev_8_21_14_0_10_36_32]